MSQIPEKEVSIENLKQVLTFYGYDIALDSCPDTFYIRSETRVSIQIHLPGEQPFIRIVTKHALARHLTYEERLKLVNEVSKRMHLCAFLLNDEGEMVSLWYQPFQYGLNVPQLLINLKRFSHANFTIWNEADWKGVITPGRPNQAESLPKPQQNHPEEYLHATCH